MTQLRLLCIEDEADIREVIKFALEDEGFELKLCASGKEALDAVADFSPDVILLDVMMPEMDGPDTLRALRVHPGLDRTPVIFCTAKTQPAEIEQLLNLGAIGVIRKPFDAMSLADDIRTALEQRNG